jgi:two-component system, chemotaxis family, CheB/CheR fusion protein
LTLTRSGKSRLPRSRFPIVGIGASAGGLAAFNELLSAIPADSGMAFVIIQHLDPTHTSMLAEALARATSMKVVTAASGTKVEPNHVYVIPPNADLALEGNTLQLVPREQSRRPHLAIDFFFRSLASHREAQAIGVVLSGSGSDGTEGLRAIKAEGGFTFAQAPSTAKFGDMPQSAIRAGVVDTGMPIPALARELVRLSRHPYVRHDRPSPAPSEKGEDSFERILALILSRTGVDFSEYKRATVERRTGRRMALRQVEGFEGYLRLLQTDDAEARALCEDVLIHVTSFFRDPAVFEAVAKEILPQILESKPKGAPLRVWVAGCSTGEEVYSLAISLLESVAYQKDPRPIQIFGSDVSEKAVEKARASLFSDASLRDLSEEMRRKYFVRLDQGYRINKQVRELCVFVRHDLARDPPFAHLDLVCCRNVLIYFGPELQKRLMATFHYCLNQPGFLVLGRSESIGGYGQFFTLIDRENKIYSRTSSRSVLQFAPSAQIHPSLPNLQVPAPMEAPGPPFDVIKHVDRLLLSKYAPAGVILNEKLEVLQFRGRTGPYLEPAPGQPQTNVLKMAREGLLLPLKTALAQARKQKAPVRKHGIEVGERGAIVRCDIVVIPLTGWPGSKEPLYAVVFEVAVPLPERAGSRHGRSKGRVSPEVTRLKRELQTSKEYLQSLLEEHSRVNDDLGTVNEELTSSNEELQSMNEELQTAKEELQSANEELTTVNDELQSGNRELNLANSDLVNLLNTVEIPILFLDAQRRIRRFTPQAQSVFNVLATDIGRPIDNIKPKIDVPDLDAQIAWSIANVTVRESQIQDQARRWHRMQIRPYQTLDGKVDGAILSLVDIDVLKRHVDQAEWSRDYAVSIVDAVFAPLVVLDEQLHVTSANEAFYETFGVPPEETENRNFFATTGGNWDIPALRTRLKDVFAKSTPFQGLEVEGEFPRVGIRTMSFSARAVHFRDSRPMILLSIEDVSLRKQVDVERKRLLAEAQHAREEAEQANRTKDAFLATLSHELRTPLATMLMNAQLLRHADLPAAKVQRASEAIERSAKAQSQLIEDLLDVSRIVTGRLSLDLRTLSMSDVVQTAVEAAALQAERKQISIEAQLGPRTGHVSGDPLRLQQVVSNLLNNAIKFTPEHGKVKVFFGNEGGDALLRVSDTGVGIDPGFLPFVFDRFAQEENSSVRRFGGLGLGLSIVRHIVEMHGGSVRAESPGRGGGATLSVRIPLLRGSQEVTPDEHVVSLAETKPAIPEWSRLRGLRVLLVDDDAETLEAVTEMLRVHGADVTTARSAAEALRAAQETQPQVIVSDIAMPGTDGYGLIRSIRALPAAEQANVPAIALTAAAGANGRKRSLEAGFQEYLEKPVDISRLAHALVDLSQPRHSA